MQAARRVHDEDVVALAFRIRHGCKSDLDGVLLIRRLQHARPEGLAENPELLDGGRAIDIQRDKRRPAALLHGEPGELGCRRRLAAALKTDEHDRVREPAGKFEPLASRAAHELHETVVDDLDDLLPGREALEDFLPNGSRPDILDEVLDDAEVHVGLEKGHPDLLHGVLDVLLVEPPAAPELLEDAVEFIG